MTEQRGIIIVVVAASLLFGCATSRPISQSSRKVGAEPSLGTTSIASVGDVIYAEYDMYITSQPGAHLLRMYRGSRAHAEISLEEGTFLAAHEGAEYCSIDRVVRDIFGHPRFVCFLDETGSGAFTEMRVPGLAFDMWTNIEPLPYRKEIRLAMGPGGGIRRELLYQGVEGNTLRITYREYKNDLARPAFFQQVSYTLSSSTTTEITFQGVELIVLEANNLGMKYIVRRGFRS